MTVLRGQPARGGRIARTALRKHFGHFSFPHGIYVRIPGKGIICLPRCADSTRSARFRAARHPSIVNKSVNCVRVPTPARQPFKGVGGSDRSLSSCFGRSFGIERIAPDSSTPALHKRCVLALFSPLLQDLSELVSESNFRFTAVGHGISNGDDLEPDDLRHR